MERTRFVQLVVVVGLCAATLPLHAKAGGSPGPDSCYSKCGSLAVNGQNCYCDQACEAAGDCCADKNEYCAPTYGKGVCALTNNPPSAPGLLSNFCGTDLGFSYAHGGSIEVLFGDSFQSATPGGSCFPPGLLLLNDDAQGRLPWAPPSWLAMTRASSVGVMPACVNPSTGAPILNLDRTPAFGSTYTFTPITLTNASGQNLPLPLNDTPLTGFSDGTRAYVVFGRGGPPETQRHVYVAWRNTASRTAYKTIVDIAPPTPFENPSAARVTSLTFPEYNFDTPPTSTPGFLLLWGRPRFRSAAGTGDTPATNGVYLLKATLPLVDAFGNPTINAAYFAGLDSTTGQPTWTPVATSAKPVVTNTASSCGGDLSSGWCTDFSTTNQLDVKWVKEIQKWVMLYGGDIPDWAPPGPPPNDQPRHGAVHMRTADYPWGPWTRPTPVLWREWIPSFYHCDAPPPFGCDDHYPYPAGDWMTNISTTSYQGGMCRTDIPQPVVPNQDPPVSPDFCGFGDAQRGNMYAPNLLPSWTYGSNDPTTRQTTATLFFTVSTWFPYQVILAAADIVTRNPLLVPKVQLRDLQNRMIGVSTTNTTNVAGGPNGGGSTAFWMYSTDQAHGYAPRVGDAVYFQNVKNGMVLARGGQSLQYVTASSPVGPDAQWKVEGVNANDGTPIAPGLTKFRLASQSSSTQHIRSQATLTVMTGTGDDSVWMTTWSCLPGDSCSR